MITALIGGKVPKHLFMTENKMEPAPASRSSGSGSSRTGATTSGPQNSVAAVKKQVLNRDATFGGHASSLQSARMAASLVSTEASLLQLKASQVLSEPEQSTLFALLHDYDKGMVTVEYLVQKITSLFKVSAGRIVLVGTNETNEHAIYLFFGPFFWTAEDCIDGGASPVPAPPDSRAASNIPSAYTSRSRMLLSIQCLLTTVRNFLITCRPQQIQ